MATDRAFFQWKQLLDHPPNPVLTRVRQNVFNGPIYGYEHIASNEGPVISYCNQVSNTRRSGQRSPSPAPPAANECAVDERVPSKAFVSPGVTGLSKREARLVKNRAAAFLSRQRKREELEIRVAELEQRLSALAQTTSAAPSDMASEVNTQSSLYPHQSRWYRETGCVISNDEFFGPTRLTSILRVPLLDAHRSSQSRLYPFPTQRLGRDISPEFVAAPGLTNTNDMFDPFSVSFQEADYINHRYAYPHMETDQIVDFPPQSGRDASGLPMGPLHHHFVYRSSPASENLVLGSISTSPSSQSPENVHPQPRLEPNFINPPDDEPPSLDGDLNSQLKGHTGVELALIALSVTVTMTVVCSDKMENHFQVCYALGILRPMFLLLHLGAALTTCAILFTPPNGGNSIYSSCLRLIWTIFFGLGLCSIVIQVSLYAWTMGNLLTRVLTVLIAILCSLPGFYFVVLKWYPGSPALRRRDVET